MPELHFPWLALCILAPLVGALIARFARDPGTARRQSLIASGLALGLALGSWLDFGSLNVSAARDRWDLLGQVLQRNVLVLDEVSAPILPLAALLYFLTNLATLRAKVREYSFVRSLVSEALLLAVLSCALPWGVVGLLAAGTVPPFIELKTRQRPCRVYAIYMMLFVALLGVGQWLVGVGGPPSSLATVGVVFLSIALLLRCGVAPLHCWATDLFEHATFGTALLFLAPLVGVYGMVRLVLPVAPEWLWQWITFACAVMALYSAGMAIVQRESRRFFCYLLLSNSALVLVGLATATPVGITGALSLWLSASLALTGFGLTMRCVEFRIGRISLAEFQGLYPHVPMLAALFLITGLASIGFPGTAGFIGLELLVDGVVQSFPFVGAMVVMVAALNGLGMMHAYFRIFTGKPRVGSIDLSIRHAERVSVLVLTALIIGGGIYPQPGVTNRYHAATMIAREHAGNTRGVPRPMHTRPPVDGTTLPMPDDHASLPGSRPM